MGELEIVMPRGDVRPFRFDVIESDGETRADIEFDNIFFTVKRNFTDRNYLFQKKLSDGSIKMGEDEYYHFTIEADDTNNLPFGDYVFDIEVFKENSVNPPIKQTFTGHLKLTSESTHANNEV